MPQYFRDCDTLTTDMLKGFFVGWKTPLSARQHLKILQNSAHIVWAEENGRCVGFINAITDGMVFAFIPMLEVIPEYQGRGIGTKLMELMLESLKDYTNIDLLCDAPLQPFYEKFGMLKTHGMVIRKFLN